MTTLLYASLFALGLIFLSFKVIGRRRAFQKAAGDGNQPELRSAIRAHANYIEYSLPFLLLLVLLEQASVSVYVLHGLAIGFFIGRMFHAYSLLVVEQYDGDTLTTHVRYRVKGMQLTFAMLGGAALTGLFTVVSYHLGL